MSIEKNLERIADSLETIAGAVRANQSAQADLMAAAVDALKRDESAALEAAKSAAATTTKATRAGAAECAKSAKETAPIGPSLPVEDAPKAAANTPKNDPDRGQTPPESAPAATPETEPTSEAVPQAEQAKTFEERMADLSQRLYEYVTTDQEKRAKAFELCKSFGINRKVSEIDPRRFDEFEAACAEQLGV